MNTRPTHTRPCLPQASAKDNRITCYVCGLTTDVDPATGVKGLLRNYSLEPSLLGIPDDTPMMLAAAAEAMEAQCMLCCFAYGVKKRIPRILPCRHTFCQVLPMAHPEAKEAKAHEPVKEAVFRRLALGLQHRARVSQ